MQNIINSIKLNVLFGEEQKSNSYSAYKAESELKRAIRNNENSIKAYLYDTHRLPEKFAFKIPESSEKEDFSLLEIINSKLTNSNIKVCLDTYEIFKEYGIEVACERLHLHSNLTII